jgi:chemotaxis protein CheC
MPYDEDLSSLVLATKRASRSLPESVELERQRRQHRLDDREGNAPLLLTEIERDALSELVNIGVSQAASGLRTMVGEQIMLSVPTLELMSHRDAVALLNKKEQGDLVAVRQSFSGIFAGRALLIFPYTSSVALAHAIVGDELTGDDFAEIENDTLAETGNIILNGCLGSIANTLNQSVEMDLPLVVRGNGARVFELDEAPTEEASVMFLYIDFKIKSRDIRGYIAMLMGVSSLVVLKQCLNDFLAHLTSFESIAAEGTQD